jgi:hypothetical protein
MRRRVEARGNLRHVQLPALQCAAVGCLSATGDCPPTSAQSPRMHGAAASVRLFTHREHPTCEICHGGLTLSSAFPRLRPSGLQVAPPRFSAAHLARAAARASPRKCEVG